jgi:multiphosphoryl transfer protein
MVGLVLVSHSRRLAEAAVDLIKRTVSPDIAIAAAGGIGDGRNELGTDALDIQEAILSVRSSDGVVVLMDMGSAILSAETAKELVSFEMQDPLLLCSAPLIEGSIAAAVQIQIGSALPEVANAARQGLAPKQDQLGDAPEQGPGSNEQSSGTVADLTRGEGKELEVVIQNEHGLHLRPAANLIKALARFRADVQITNESTQRGPIPAKSLVDLARLQVRQGNRVRFVVSGPDVEDALATINELVRTNFGEAPSTAAAPPPAPATAGAEQPFPVSSGIALGKPLFLNQIEPPLPDYSVSEEPAIQAELQKLGLALEKAGADFDRRYERLQSSLEPETLAILDAQRLILADSTITGDVENAIREQHQNAAQAWHSALTALAAEQEASPDAYLRARAADFREIRSLVLNELRGDTEKLVFPGDATNTILVCDELTPSLADAIRSTRIAGVLQLHGGATSHGAILARALRLPSIGGAAAISDQIRTADLIGFDGEKGKIWINPNLEQRTELAAQQRASQTAFEVSVAESQQPAKTQDNVLINVAGNAGSKEDMMEAVRYGADSVGLFRSEFLFQKFDRLPSEDDQLTTYEEALAPIGKRLVTLRLLDIGGDKPLPFLTVPREANPFLGVRGIRLLAQNPAFFRSHLRAVLRLSAKYEIRVLVPMLTDGTELVSLRERITQLHEELASEKLPHHWPIPIGAMIETPAAAILADQLAADFLSFGTNDLTQYVLCAERGNPLLNSYSDALHPAVLRVCQRAIELALNRKVSLSICGEIASDPDAVPVLLGLGLRDLSVTPAAIPNLKSLIRRLNIGKIGAQFSETLMSFKTAEAVRAFGRAVIDNQ